MIKLNFLISVLLLVYTVFHFPGHALVLVQELLGCILFL